jgi:putative PEP-CTERM system histidine kinase
MTPGLFALLTLLLNLVLSLTVVFRKYQRKTTIPLLGIGVLLPVANYLGIQFFGNTIPVESYYVFVKMYYGLSVVAVVFISYISCTFLRTDNHLLLFKGRLSLNVNIFYSVILVFGLLVVSFLPMENIRGEDIIPFNSTSFDLLLFLILALHIYSLYSLEKTWHYAHEYQRRITRLFFIPMIILIAFNILFYTTAYIYHSINPMILQVNLIVQGITFPVLLVGFFRYRIANEKVIVPRNTVYSSFSLFLSGAAFLGIGTTLYLFKIFNIDFEWFESTLLVLSITFLLFLLVSSGSMRRRIIRFVNNQFYSNKYDYRDQFFRLNQAYLDSTTLDNAVVNLVENIKYAVTATDAFVFLKDPHSNSFTLKRNPEFGSMDSITIPANDPIILAFEKNSDPLVLNHPNATERESAVRASFDKRITSLSPTNIFPIIHNDTIDGILLIVINSRKLDIEDNALICVFTQAIGSLYHKNFLQQKEVESGQFQSFNQIVSFVVHDLKNQIATLSLIAKNADTYIENPEFQKSLIRSIRTCTENLMSLTETLSKSRKGLVFSIAVDPVLPVIEKVINSPLVTQNNGVTVAWINKESCNASIDSTALEHVVINLIKNAIEAMEGNGTLRLYCGDADRKAMETLKRFNLSDSQIEKRTAVICIEDNGCGMDSDFVETKLFKPFETTKDKGIGIGLYQCKTYIEKMNGILLCSSEAGDGTAFCILL